MDEDRESLMSCLRDMRLQAVLFPLHGLKKTAPNCYLNSVSVQICFNKSVPSSTSSNARKNLTSLEQPFLLTGAVPLGALDGLLTLKVREEQEPKQTPKSKSIHFLCSSLGNQVALLLCYFTTKRILQRRVYSALSESKQPQGRPGGSAAVKSMAAAKTVKGARESLSLILKRKSEQESFTTPMIIQENDIISEMKDCTERQQHSLLPS